MDTSSVVKISEGDLSKLADEMYMDPTYLKRVRDMMKHDEMVVFAVEHEGIYVGRCSLWLGPADEPEVRKTLPGVPLVNALEIHPDYYRKGLATMLIYSLENEVKKRGKTQLTLGVEPQNTPGRALYEKLGFHYILADGQETYPCFWYETASDGTPVKHEIDARLMVKELV